MLPKHAHYQAVLHPVTRLGSRWLGVSQLLRSTGHDEAQTLRLVPANAQIMLGLDLVSMPNAKRDCMAMWHG
jgi:hypothetical protein